MNDIGDGLGRIAGDPAEKEGEIIPHGTFSEEAARSLAKALSWRAVGTLGTFVAVWVLTGRPGLAAGVGGLEGILKLALFYLHERAWNRISAGRRRVSRSSG